MNTKRILGIAALLAVLVMCLTFTACPVDEEERSVKFINKTSSPIEITFSNASRIELEACPQNAAEGQEPSKTATKKGEDLILDTIAFTGSKLTFFELEKILSDYVTVSGAVVAGKEVKKGLALGNGTMVFEPKKGLLENPAWYKISAITLDE